jgi:nucleotide-binding universal stress UspA family protein
MNAPLDHPPIVVGVDASPTSEPALRWAIAEASTRRIPLKLVSAWNPGFDIDALGLATREVEAHCRAVLDHAKEEVNAADPSIPVTTTTYIGPALTALIDASRNADTVVVGSRGLRPLRALLIGATSLEVAAHAECPAVLVRETATSRPGGRVVVGVDGTPQSAEAVAYGFAYASAHAVDLTVLHAFQVEYVAGVISGLSAEDSTTRVAQEELVLTAEAVAGWREKSPDVKATTVTTRDHPVDALIEASRTAALVVIGGHRRGRIGGALLGAVGHGILHRAHCPVAVVRPRSHS